MNVLSLFDGMSCGRIALQRAGIPISHYYASEIDKYAIAVSKRNYPDIIHLGDINNWMNWNLPPIDLIIGGSPCQGFSLAGKQLNFDDPRSKLFFIFDDIRRTYKPKYWLLENVKMKKGWQDTISEILGVEPVEINSALVSAQNRKRLYWANFPISQPEDKGILLKDIIEYEEVDRDKSYTIDANYFKGGNPRSYFEDGRRQLVFEHQSHKRAMIRIEGAAMRGRYNEEGKVVQQMENNGTEKSNSLTTVQKDSLIRIGTASDIKGHDYNKRVYSVHGKSPTLATHTGGNLEPKIAVDDYHYRKLTVLECERLQTVPEGYTAGVSNTQRYKMLGNGWTIDVICGIIQNIGKESNHERRTLERDNLTERWKSQRSTKGREILRGIS